MNFKINDKEYNVLITKDHKNRNVFYFYQAISLVDNTQKLMKVYFTSKGNFKKKETTRFLNKENDMVSRINNHEPELVLWKFKLEHSIVLISNEADCFKAEEFKKAAYITFFSEKSVCQGGMKDGCWDGKIEEACDDGILKKSTWKDGLLIDKEKIDGSLVDFVRKGGELKKILFEGKDCEWDDVWEDVKLYKKTIDLEMISVDVFLEKIDCSKNIKAYKIEYDKRSYWLKYNLSKEKELMERLNVVGLKIAGIVVKVPVAIVGRSNGKRFTFIEDIKYAKRTIANKISKPSNFDSLDLYTAMKNDNFKMKLSKLGSLVGLGCLVDDVKTLNIGCFINNEDNPRLGLFDCSILTNSLSIKKGIKGIDESSFMDIMMILHYFFNYNDSRNRDENGKCIESSIISIENFRNGSIFKLYFTQCLSLIELKTKDPALSNYLLETSFLYAFVKLYKSRKEIENALSTMKSTYLSEIIKGQYIEFLNLLCSKYIICLKAWSIQNEKYQTVFDENGAFSDNKIEKEKNKWQNDVLQKTSVIVLQDILTQHKPTSIGQKK
jgi:hypothetical protein